MTMAERMLFSPVGTADPLSPLGDGPLVHIVRHYHPELVVLFLSPAMAAKQDEDQRYTLAIEHIAPETVVRLVRSEIEDVHRIDGFIADFRQQLTDLAKEFSCADLLLNLSSGTPAMQSALVALNAFGIPQTTAIQVPTPKKGPNDSDSRWDINDYDLALLEEENKSLDDAPGAVNRCIEVPSPAFGALLQRDMVKQLLLAYAYDAAQIVSKDALLPESTRLLIVGLAERMTLQADRARGRFAGTPFPVRNREEVKEAIAVLSVLSKRKQWLDFARATTPIVDAIVNREVSQRTRLSLRDLEKPDYHKFRTRYDLLNPDTRTRFQPLVTFHEKIRNDAAHSLTAMTSSTIKKKTGYSPNQIVSLLADFSDADPNLYDKINAYLIEQIDGAPLHF
jgi:hypothetical protein